MTGGYVYLLTNRKHGALYIGVTANLPARMEQHRKGEGSAFCAKYGINRLMVVEPFGTIGEAIAREKALKKWRRAWKVELIDSNTPDWRDLYFDINR